tara:strand:+ start:1198 stop:1821 length:624 start_codon:yes stop_codon:yes gene_type:complete
MKKGWQILPALFFYLAPMYYTLDITGTADAAAIVSTANLKEFLRVDHTDEDTLIEALRLAAIDYVQNYCNLQFGDVTAIMYLDNFPGHWEIPTGPVQSITSITYNPTASTTSTLSVDNYFVDTKRKPARITMVNPPSVYPDISNGVQVNMSLGYLEADVPAGLVHGIRLLVAHYYENRNIVAVGSIATEVPNLIHSLLNPYRIISDR